MDSILAFVRAISLFVSAIILRVSQSIRSSSADTCSHVMSRVFPMRQPSPQAKIPAFQIPVFLLGRHREALLASRNTWKKELVFLPASNRHFWRESCGIPGKAQRAESWYSNQPGIRTSGAKRARPGSYPRRPLSPLPLTDSYDLARYFQLRGMYHSSATLAFYGVHRPFIRFDKFAGIIPTRAVLHILQNRLFEFGPF